MKQIKVVNYSRFILVDDEDYPKLKQFNWHLTGSVCECVTTIINNITVPITNIIMNTRGVLFDHKDRNYLNNQKENLREATSQQNSMNRGKPDLWRGATSIYKGVSWSKTKRLGNKHWKTGIKVNGKQIHLGYYESEAEAAKVYNTAAQEYFGEFAFINEII